MSKSETNPGFRSRSINFNQHEVHLLLEQVEVHRIAILNRSTTAAANKMKHKVWMKIVKIFKERKLGPERTEECLRSKWENLKRESSKQAKSEMEISFDEKKSILNRVLAVVREAGKNPAEPTQSDDGDDNSKEVDKKGVFWDDSQASNEDKQSAESMDEDDDNTESEKMVKNRSINFSPLESRLLLQCIRPEKKYILSTEITSKANLMKSKAWERVTEEFNKRNPVKRSHLTLRTKLENMKKIAKRSSFKEFMKDLGQKHQKLVNENTLPHKIKTEPISKDHHTTENTNGYNLRTMVEIEPIDPANLHPVNQLPSKHVPGNEVSLDPLSTVLNQNIGNSFTPLENKEVVKLQLDLLNFQMETAKLERERVTRKIEVDEAERQARELETSLRLRTARLHAAAAEMKLPVGHPALLYTPAERPAQHYVGGDDCV